MTSFAACLRRARPRHGLFRMLAIAISHHKQRQHLLALDAHLLRDIGVTPARAATEARKPFWDVPCHWLG